MEQPNMSYIHSMSGGDKVFEQKLIDIIKCEFPEEKAVFYSNLELEDYQKAADNVHKLKHKILILGLEKSYHTAVAFEEKLREGDVNLKAEFEAILITITNYLKTL
ncbi:Hpt domain-containing protein [Aestuariibaculum suncheonense]|uniref:Hpt domain-containing protein n=1 Tax=Aestuariibaculum suncheonense TaxID=1028745 RepID=A0A8J6QFH5_9FLAO|nr:Hpt domain-containing protein [Aestuariibaculum suncheonense]MBD0835818.1 Hpt domain-containing protein [Aestuariibaculum suncheonense]